MMENKNAMPAASNDASGIDILTCEQVRAARALLQWDQKELAARSNVSIATIKRLEPLSGPLKANRVTIDAIRRALETAGVDFIPANGGGPGVRLSRRN